MLWRLILPLLTALSPDLALEFGIRVWQNECACTLDGLTAWNDGEEFASLGIGHFIWYPRGKDGPFAETFPSLMQFFREQTVSLPRWLDEARFCPWKDRKAFLAARHDKKMVELRTLLKKTIDLQAQFLMRRLEASAAEIFPTAPNPWQQKSRARYDRLMSEPDGMFALLDYVNFKGYGTSPKETYAGYGWGLLQVLDNMSDDPKLDPIVEFVRSAKEMLEQRVANAPSGRNEQRYLKGWFYRLDTYLGKKQPPVPVMKKKQF
jgi:hypothetical protein